jgi:hypothetical protein
MKIKIIPLFCFILLGCGNKTEKMTAFRSAFVDLNLPIVYALCEHVECKSISTNGMPLQPAGPAYNVYVIHANKHTITEVEDIEIDTLSIFWANPVNNEFFLYNGKDFWVYNDSSGTSRKVASIEMEGEVYNTENEAYIIDETHSIIYLYEFGTDTFQIYRTSIPAGIDTLIHYWAHPNWPNTTTAYSRHDIEHRNDYLFGGDDFWERNDSLYLDFIHFNEKLAICYKKTYLDSIVWVIDGDTIQKYCGN